MSGSARPLTYVPLGRIVPKSTGLADSEVVILDRRTHVSVLLETLAAYYEEESDLELGAGCGEFGFKIFFIRGKLVQVATT